MNNLQHLQDIEQAKHAAAASAMEQENCEVIQDGF